MKTLLALIFLILLSATLPAFANDAEVQSRWNNLSDAQKQRLRENYDRWKALDSQKQAALRNNFKRFRETPTEDRQRIVQRYQLFRSLPAERQQRIRDRFTQFMKLPREVRQQRINKLQDFRIKQEGTGGPGLRSKEDEKQRGEHKPPGPRSDNLRESGPRPFRQGEGMRGRPRREQLIQAPVSATKSTVPK